MRSKILEILRGAADEYISGEEIAQRLQVSRTAIWKHIKELKQAGYGIESHQRSGYRLVQSPDLLLPNEIKRRLRTRLLGQNVVHYENIATTNEEAKTLARQGAADGTIVVSESQGGGKGRLSRSWFSPYGKGIWFSIILRPHILPHNAPKCTLMAAVAIAKAIDKCIGVAVGIKWPNDILHDGKKLVGILTEMSAEIDRINYVVIGMGINVNMARADFSDDIGDIATSLAQIKGEPVSRLDLLCEIIEQLEILYDEMEANGFSAILEEWKRYSVTLGQTVKVIGFDETFIGKALDIDADGALMVETGDGVQRILAGDVSIRPNQ